MTTTRLKAGSWRANVTPLPGARRRSSNKGVGQRIALLYHEGLWGTGPEVSERRAEELQPRTESRWDQVILYSR